MKESTGPKAALFRSGVILCLVVIACCLVSLLESSGGGVVRLIGNCLIPFGVGYILGRVFRR